MWRLTLASLLVMWGLVAVAFLAWCQHRVSGPVLMWETAWPRPWPYPDRWLARWYQQIEAEKPSPPGRSKVCPEGLYRLQGRLRVYTLSALFVIAAGVALALWPPTGRETSPEPSGQRGVAIGLVLGSAWAAFIGHQTEGPSSVWLLFGVFATGFAMTGAVVGVVRPLPELVGLGAGCLCLVVQALCFETEVDLDRLLRWNGPMTVGECLRIVAGVDWNLDRLLLFGGSGLFWGAVIGALHRLFRPVANAEPDAREDRPCD